MNKFLLACVALALPALAVAQDMPLHEIIKAGETWQPVKAEMPAADKLPVTFNLKTVADRVAAPSCTALWHNGATVLVGDAGGKHVWAFRADGAGGEKYLPLRLRKGDEKSEVSALCVDGQQRVYAAYKEGIMAFDPTGRPCGLITSPGPVKALAFEGNVLYAQVGDQVYARKMLATK